MVERLVELNDRLKIELKFGLLIPIAFIGSQAAYETTHKCLTSIIGYICVWLMANTSTFYLILTTTLC